MNNRDKILAEFDETIVEDWLDADYHSNKLPVKFNFADFQLIGELLNPCIKAFLSSKIAQTLAEERERVGKIIEESHWECPEHGLPKFQKTDCVECDSALEINVVLGALLSSLDTNPKDI